MKFPFALTAGTPLYLAPMAGVSESPFRELCREHGADVVVTEFLSAEGITRENRATIHKLAFGPADKLNFTTLLDFNAPAGAVLNVSLPDVNGGPSTPLLASTTQRPLR